MPDRSDRKHSDFIRVAVIENTFESQLLSSILAERGIPFEMRSHHDTAYDGLYQMQKGWGGISATAEHRAIILEILEQIRSERPMQDLP